MTDLTEHRRWYDSTRIISVLAFVLYGCVMAWAAMTHNEMSEIQDRLRAREINEATIQAEARALRMDVSALKTQLDRIEDNQKRQDETLRKLLERR